MATVNTKARDKDPQFIAGGSPAAKISAHQSLRRSVMTCLLWENEFYEDGVSITTRIEKLVAESEPGFVASLAIECRDSMKLRHMPLQLCNILAKQGTLRADTLTHVIQRADELCEFLALYWKGEKQEKNQASSIDNQVKKGLAAAFLKFNEYQFSKYNRDNEVKLRDVMFLCHPKPQTPLQEATFKKIASDTLEVADTWEVALSGGKDKKETFERLINEKKLGYLALIRNLRNMQDSGVDDSIINAAIKLRHGADRVLPFRFVAAAKQAPKFESALNDSMLETLQTSTKLKGKTLIVVDVSGSMYNAKISSKSEMDRAYVACTLAAFLREVCEDPIIYATGGNDFTKVHQTELVPARHGMSLVDAIYGLQRKLGGGGIFLTPVCKWLADKEKNVHRMIVVTDEQDCAGNGENSPLKATPLGKKNYLVNVASAKNGIGYGKWLHIDGWSEGVVDYIFAHENSQE